MLRFILGFIFVAFSISSSAFAEEQPPVTLWAEEAVSQTLTFGFADHEERLKSARQKYFSPAGWESFQQNLDKIIPLKNVIEYQMTVTAFSPSSSYFQQSYARRAETPPKTIILVMSELGPQITAIEVPLLISFKAGSKKIVKQMRIIVELQRMKQENDYALTIMNWNLKDK